jgi:hypothetical protein
VPVLSGQPRVAFYGRRNKMQSTSLIPCDLMQLQERCVQRGFTLDEVLSCVVKRDGDRVVVDTSHPSYPRRPKPGFEPQAVESSSPPDLARTDAPSFLSKVKNFAAAATGHVAAGMPMASDEEIIRRHDICLGCEHLQDNACTQCGCPVSRIRGYVSKLSWADQECPAGKWGKVEPKSLIDP